MAHAVIDTPAIESAIFDQLVGDLDAIGREAADFARRETPVLTGHAQRSIFYVVLDERGNVIAGDTHDGNGQSIPNTLPQHANGRLRVFVGANAPYYIWIEVGANGRPGKQILARVAGLLSDRWQQLMREQHTIGGG